MNDEFGYVRLFDPESKIEYTAVVLVLQTGKQFNFCPVWKEETNRLVPIMKSNDGFYIDASDPFAYELWANKNFEERIREFNNTYLEKGIEDIKIYKIASVSDLERAGLPVYKEEGSERVIIS